MATTKKTMLKTAPGTKGGSVAAKLAKSVAGKLARSVAAKSAKSVAAKLARSSVTKPPLKKTPASKKSAAPKTKQAAPAAPKAAEPKLDTNRLAEGDRVPSFSAKSAVGLVSNASLKGQAFVLYFYPKDDTPGCTREACGFRDTEAAFKSAGVQILGVSPDSTESHGRFGEKYGLPFKLLSDADKSLALAFGVWVKKKNYGREYMGIERTTFLVDAVGKVQRVWRNVKVDGHVEKVLAAAATLSK